MNKAEFIRALAEKADLSLKDAAAAVDAYAEVVAEALKDGEKVAIAGLGTFELKAKAERQGFNPVTMEPITIPASNAPTQKNGGPMCSMSGNACMIVRYVASAAS